MDIVERLRICAKNDPHDTKDNIFATATDEIKRLRQQNAELVYAVKWIVTEDERSDPFRMACAIDHAKEVIAKATGGE